MREFKKITEKEVKRANKNFYNIVADIYEEVDGRRNDDLRKWIDSILRDLSIQAGGQNILDVGCGNGFILQQAKLYFKNIVGLDISDKILSNLKDDFSLLICGDGGVLPFRDNLFNVVSCFSVLHHIYDHKPLFKEIYRVLKWGGIFYSDHDIEKRFVQLLYFPLLIYRHFNNKGKKYITLKEGITKEMYEVSEYHSNGIDSKKVINLIYNCGFSQVKVKYHWFGLQRLFNSVFKYHGFPRGLAPLFSIFAIK